MKYKGHDIQTVYVPSSGFTYSFELHLRFAAQWAGYKWHEFVKLDGIDQDDVVATYEARMSIDATASYQASKQRPRAK